MREIIAWDIEERPEASDRFVAGQTGVNHRTVASVQAVTGDNGEILHLPNRPVRTASSIPPPPSHPSSPPRLPKGRRAKSLLDRLGEDAPSRPASIRVLHKLLNRKEREELKSCPEAKLPAIYQD